ncbi:MAG TPA: M23 family metallopeptidase, partial [Cyclobacteriaceae bacterium]|nr:M23 family metallopeptidase [Cyclobacteriaceae bacterium]
MLGLPLKPKKTISERLSARYQMVIRSEESLEETSSLGFTYAKILVFSIILFVVLFIGSLFLAQTLLAKWFDPRYAHREANKKIDLLVRRFDSLAVEEQNKAEFIANVKRIFNGDTLGGAYNPEEALRQQDKPIKPVSSMKLAASDSQFRKSFEQSELSLVTLTGSKYRELRETFFFTPLTGVISDRYDVKKGHYGIDIVAKTNEPVKCIADGTVIMASWTQDAGYVIAIQHRGNLISVFKHNAELLKKVGSFVNAGEIISIVGNSGEMTDGPHLHFELWYNGNSLNPEE